MSPGSDSHVIRLWSAQPEALASLSGLLVELGISSEAESACALRDSYLDTDDWWLYRAGVACRVRSGAAGATVALGPLCGRTAARCHAAELSDPIERPPMLFPAPLPAGRLADRLAPLMHGAPVDVKLEHERLTTTYRAVCADGPALRLSASVVHPVGTTGGGAFAELVLEGPPEASRLLDELAGAVGTRLAMEPCAGSIMRPALAAAGIAEPMLEEGPELTLRREDRFVDAAYRVLHRHFRRMVWNEPGTRLGIEPECLHDMRVATRRMRAALRVFDEALPARRVQAVKRDLKWIGQALGGVRDLDVYLVHLRDETRSITPALQPAMELYMDEVRSRRAKARAAMLSTLNTRRYSDFVRRLRAFLEAGPPARPNAPRAREPLTEMARSIILKGLKRVLGGGRDAGRQSPDSQLHRLRIHCKRLRYACEFFSDIYGKPASVFAERVVTVQDILGEHQDAVVARGTLSRFAAELKGPARRSRQLYMGLGELTALHYRRARQARSRFFKRWKKFDRKKVRRPLMNRLDRLRPSPHAK